MATRNAIPRFRSSAAWLTLLAGLLVLAPAAAADDTQGFIYGRVTTESGSVYEGRIRWGNEEAFWGDFFNSTKTREHRPYLDRVPKSERYQRKPIKVFGITIGTRYDNWSEGRILKIRFGDIDKIHTRGDDRARLILKSGDELELDGGSNDMGAKILVWDAGVGEIELDWERVERVDFLPTPKDLEIDVHRLYGTVETEDGEFRGWIQWDQDECVSSDKLDGDSRDGSLSLPMGKIRLIEKRSNRSSLVVLHDDRELVLDGSNDVNNENRGIYVEDDRYGRVLISWDAFERVEFSRPGNSGPAYDDYAAGKRLRGKVTDTSGNAHSGQIVWDLDETESWEFLDGDWGDISYSVPFEMIAAIVPEGDESSRVILRNGKELVLEDAADVGEGNAGIAVVLADGEIDYIPWDRVRRADFEM